MGLLDNFVLTTNNRSSMNSQDFLTLNLLGAGGFLFWYFISRGGPRRPTQLNMKAKDSAPPLVSPLPSQPQEAPVLRRVPAAKEAPPKNLNVMFNYNGHSWDAYEVLGVPAGASIRIVTEAYQTAIHRSSKDSVDFLETAYRAILNKGS